MIESTRANKFCYLFVILSIALSGCAHKKKLTREQWINATQRTYTGVEKEKLIEKAQEVLTLADGDDVQFAHSQNGFSASRSWFIYLVFAASAGTDTWTFQVDEEKPGVFVAKLSVNSSEGTVAPSPAAGGGTFTTPTQGQIIEGNAIYSIFWSRLDYLLGKTDQWMDCKLAAAKQKAGEFFGHDEPLCNSFNLANSYPLNLSDAEVDRIFGKNFTRKKEYLEKRRQPAKTTN